MLDLSRFREQLSGFNAYQAQEQDALSQKLTRALEALAECNPQWEAVRERVGLARVPWLIAELCEPPGQAHACGPRPTPMTVVATDGSQIYPDRHVEPTCYLLNVSRVVFQYGTLERPLMESVPFFQYRRSDLEHYLEQFGIDVSFDGVFERATTDIVSALRDQLELESLADAAKAVRLPGRPIVALADGTLIRWMLSNVPNREIKERLTDLYVRTLAVFREERIPVCSYISMPRNTEVVNFLRASLGENDASPGEESLAGLMDRTLFERVLRPNERSALFRSASHIQQAYDPEDRICYFYVRVPAGTGGDELSRVEVPQWVADDPALVDMIHALVLSECEKGQGYPVILSEAHEQAVIRAREKDIFYHMIETEMLTAGLAYNGSRKQASKRRPVV